jgi:hypothetical protein
MNLIEKLGLEKCKAIVDGAPTFIRESISQDETAYNPRTKKYIERGPCSVLIQLDGEDDYYHSTMPYHSSFYSECIFLKDLRAAIADHNRTDYVSDIRNHISPLTKVIER